MVPRQVLSSPVGEPLAAADGCFRVSVTEQVLGGPRGIPFCSVHSAGSSPWEGEAPVESHAGGLPCPNCCLPGPLASR